MTAAITALVVAGASTAASVISTRKASKAQRRSNEAQRRINRLKNFQAKRQFLRNFRQAQAQTLVSAIASGVGIESSRTQGTLSGQGSQARSATSEFNFMDELGGEMTSAMNAQSKYQMQSGIYGQIGSFALSFASMAAGPTTRGAAEGGGTGFGTSNSSKWQIGGING